MGYLHCVHVNIRPWGVGDNGGTHNSRYFSYNPRGEVVVVWKLWTTRFDSRERPEAIRNINVTCDVYYVHSTPTERHRAVGRLAFN